MAVREIERDFLELEFADSDKLYVPRSTKPSPSLYWQHRKSAPDYLAKNHPGKKPGQGFRKQLKN